MKYLQKRLAQLESKLRYGASKFSKSQLFAIVRNILLVEDAIAALTVPAFPFINRPIAEVVRQQSIHKITVMIEGVRYIVRYFSSEGSNRAWNRLKNEVKAQSRWDAARSEWKAVCGYDEFCQDFRLANCEIIAM